MGGAKSLEKDESISSIEEIEENDDTLTEIEESEIEDSDDDDLYAVERIVDKRILMNQVGIEKNNTYTISCIYM